MIIRMFLTTFTCLLLSACFLSKEHKLQPYPDLGTFNAVYAPYSENISKAIKVASDSLMKSDYVLEGFEVTVFENTQYVLVRYELIEPPTEKDSIMDHFTNGGGMQVFIRKSDFQIESIWGDN